MSNKKQSFAPAGQESLVEAYNLSPALKVNDTVWCSGQVGMDENGFIPESYTEQAELAFKNLKAVLEAAGASLDDIVDLITFHVDLPGQAADVVEVKNKYIKSPYPSWTGVGVVALADPALKLEIKATAVIGSGKNNQ